MRLLVLALLAAAAPVLSAPAVGQAERTPAAERLLVPQVDPRLVQALAGPAGPGVPGASQGPAPAGGVQPVQRYSTLRLIVGGVLGGGIGLVGGFAAGVLVDGEPDSACRGTCSGSGRLWGILIGETAGIALGVSLANGLRGSAAMTMITSAAIATGGLLLAADWRTSSW